ncbi:MAG: hypothetical protein V2J55_18375 [Candidatus Competibacteraceae bacterium]|jgi:hypothetical protein|nr:hypothetical protein [Candidatus Competibacteraceae bacterium]
MEEYPYKLSALYHDQSLAEQAQQALLQLGFPAEQLRITGPEDPGTGAKLEPEGDKLPLEITKDTAIGTGIGAGIGATGSAALAIAQAALFATNPVLSTLVITGYAATVGGLAGAIKGIKMKETLFVGIVEQALQQGHWALVVHARDEEQETAARKILGKTVIETQGTVSN